MSNAMLEYFNSNLQGKAFDRFRRGRSIGLFLMIYLFFRGIFIDLPLFLITYCPNPFGITFRNLIGKIFLKKFGKRSIIDRGVSIIGYKNVSISDYVWIDQNVHINAVFGEVSIGRRVHIAPNCIISGLGKVIIEDYVGISSGVKIYSHSEAPRNGKRISGPMIPEEMKSMVTKPVILEKDAFIGTGAVILPGVVVGEGAVIVANSVVTKNAEPWSITGGIPAKKLGRRHKVTVDDI